MPANVRLLDACRVAALDHGKGVEVTLERWDPWGKRMEVAYRLVVTEEQQSLFQEPTQRTKFYKQLEYFVRMLADEVLDSAHPPF